jgi:hypothetical protein
MVVEIGEATERGEVMAKLNSLADRQKHMHGLAEAAEQIAREERQARITHDRDIDLEHDIALQVMLRDGAKLDLQTYLEYAFFGEPPEGIENDAEFIASVPDIILKNTKFKM